MDQPVKLSLKRMLREIAENANFPDPNFDFDLTSDGLFHGFVEITFPIPSKIYGHPCAIIENALESAAETCIHMLKESTGLQVHDANYSELMDKKKVVHEVQKSVDILQDHTTHLLKGWLSTHEQLIQRSEVHTSLQEQSHMLLQENSIMKRQNVALSKENAMLRDQIKHLKDQLSFFEVVQSQQASSPSY